LETRISFQEQTIQELNEVVTSQEQRIDFLERSVKALVEQLRSGNESLVVDESRETPPPHY